MRLMAFTFSLSRRPTVAVIRLQGTIAAGGRGGLSDASLAPVITRAFAKKPVAVALAVNSPGGSPVQSALIAARTRVYITTQCPFGGADLTKYAVGCRARARGAVDLGARTIEDSLAAIACGDL